MSNSFSVQIEQILEGYDEKVVQVSKEAMEEVAKEAVQKLRNSSPKGSRGKYAKGWTTSTQNGVIVVHNKVYQLTHLLENGHVIRNQHGTYGRTRAIKHIEPVEQWANEEVEEVIRRKLES